MSSLYIGLISGTSVDGIDVALVDFDSPLTTVVATLHSDIPVELQRQLLAFNMSAKNELDSFASCDVLFGRLCAQSINQLLKTTSHQAHDIIAIGSHGQTVRHYPLGETPTTIQIGDPNIIAELTGITTVADFRRRDMAAGGQGAPLVPAFHAEIFRQAGEARAILNLGGIANLTLLPAETSQPVTGFDSGPANCLLNDWIKCCKQIEYDESGQWAASGNVVQHLLDSLMQDTYFELPPPKSTGRDYFNLAWIQRHLDATSNIRDVDVQATLAELTARSVANDLIKFLPASQRLFVCGGGAHNADLLNRLKHHLPQLEIETTSSLGIDPDYVEATAFAWLAKQTMEHKPGSLCSVTGAKGNRILGGIYQA